MQGYAADSLDLASPKQFDSSKAAVATSLSAKPLSSTIQFPFPQLVFYACEYAVTEK
jgi:hypothetical protein